MKVFVVGGDLHYANWIKDAEITGKLMNADIVLFTGGEDVDPSIYGCKKHPRTYSNIIRDKAEIEIFNKVRSDQLVIGVCRGSQLMSAINGGRIVQNVYNHALWGTHEITNGKDTYEITSTHHQMQYPYCLKDEDYDILYWAKGLSDAYEGDKINSKLIEEKGEPEIVLYHKGENPKCLAIQGHPEMMAYCELHDMLNGLIRKYGNL